MRIIMIFLILLPGCGSKKEVSLNNEFKNILSVSKTWYQLNLDGNEQMGTNEEMYDVLKRSGIAGTEDSLHIVIYDAPAESLENVLKILRDLEINKYRVVLTDEYFRLPYPDSVPD